LRDGGEIGSDLEREERESAGLDSEEKKGFKGCVVIDSSTSSQKSRILANASD
jgi:hypothetical protein